RSSRDHEGLAIQRFADGPLALLPMSEPHLLSLIWSTSKNKAKAILEMNEVAFLHEVNAASEGVCGKIVEADRRYSLPVFQQVVSSLHPCPGAVLIGDTARTIHPLAGFGVNLGIEDVRSLETRVLAGAGGLSGWARQRQLRSRMMTTLMWSFERLWGARGAYALTARNSGVKWYNEFSA
ncbi:MAG: FAD-dependent monooxygenase, partial [Pseudomonadales bacterium]|nr:FAD-dependent monooxygenase [Pseudomonadales bacterium]